MKVGRASTLRYRYLLVPLLAVCGIAGVLLFLLASTGGVLGLAGVGTAGLVLLLLLAGAALPTALLLSRDRQLRALRSQLRAREAKLEALVDHAPIAVVVKDLEGRYVRANRIAMEIFGDHPVLGRTTEEVWDGDIAERFRADDRRVVEEGRPRRDEERLPTPSGERDFLSVRCPIRDSDGTITNIAVFMLDIDELKKAERSLRTSEARFRDFAESASDWFWETDAEHRFVDSFGRFKHEILLNQGLVVGRTREEIAGAEQIAAEPEKWRAHRALLAARSPFRDFEYDVIDLDGRIRTVRTSGVPVFGEDGTFFGYRGSARDVTEKRAAESAFKAAETLQHALIDSVPVWLAYVDKDLRYRFSNTQFAQTAWLAGRDFIGRSVAEMAPPEVYERMTPGFEAALSGETSVFEDSRPMADGSTRHFRIHYVPHRDAEGAVAGLFILGEDLTELKRMQDRLRDQAEQLRLIADSVPGGVAYFDHEHRYRFVNRLAAQRHGANPEAVVGRHYGELWGEVLYQRARPYLERAMAGEEVAFEDRRTLATGEERDLHIQYMPHRDASGMVTGCVGLAVDITERKALEEQLRHTQKMDAVGKLTGGVAHDFNNLLLAIQANLELLDEGMPEQDDRHELVERALRGVGRAADLTRRLLAFSRRQPLQPESVDVGALVVDSVRMFRRTLEETIEVTSRIGDGAMTARIDAGQLESALLNLAVNARDAMGSGGQLVFDVDRVDSEAPGVFGRPRSSGAYVRIKVRDTGAGMSEDVRSRVFEPFFTTKEFGHGTGLGLSMVHGFMEQSGGFVDIDSAPGQGTTISLYFPFVETCAAEAEPAPERGVAAGSGLILLVEDDPLVREATSDMLADFGYDVRVARNGVEAETLLEEDSSYDLLLSDIVMPGGVSGIDLAERVRESWPEMRIVLTTGYADGVVGGEGVPGVARLLRKPYSRATLARVLHDVLTDEVAA